MIDVVTQVRGFMWFSIGIFLESPSRILLIGTNAWFSANHATITFLAFVVFAFRFAIVFRIDGSYINARNEELLLAFEVNRTNNIVCFHCTSTFKLVKKHNSFVHKA